jgi:hypothetical protein
MPRTLTAIALIGLLLAVAQPAHAIVGGQVSNFQDGTLQGWVTGPQAPLPTNIATGGPAGAGDHYLRVDPFTHLAVYNPSPWNGDYATAGILDVGVDFLNFNPNTMANVEKMRIVLFGPSGSRWTSTNPVTVNPNNLWQHFTFSLRQSDLTQVVSGDTYGATLAAVDRIMFRHDNGVTPSTGGTPFSGSIGIDNVTAIVPEPTGLLGVFTLAGMCRRSRPKGRG